MTRVRSARLVVELRAELLVLDVAVVVPESHADFVDEVDDAAAGPVVVDEGKGVIPSEARNRGRPDRGPGLSFGMIAIPRRTARNDT